MANFSSFQSRHVVQAVNFLDVETIHEAVVDHYLATATAFFGRLENDHHGAVKIPGFRQVFRCAKQHCRVSVMPTCMHAFVGPGCIVQTGRFLHRQRVHICPEPDNQSVSVGPALDDPNHSGFSDARCDLITAEFRQLVGDKCGCPVGVEQQFRVLVNVPTPTSDFFMKIGEDGS